MVDSLNKYNEIFAWVFLYLLVALFVAVYILSIQDVYLELSEHKTQIHLISPLFLLLLPTALPAVNIVSVALKRTEIKKNQKARVCFLLSILLFLTFMLLGYFFEHRAKHKLLEAGFRPCESLTLIGLRAFRKTYVERTELCER